MRTTTTGQVEESSPMLMIDIVQSIGIVALGIAIVIIDRRHK